MADAKKIVEDALERGRSRQSGQTPSGVYRTAQQIVDNLGIVSPLDRVSAAALIARALIDEREACAAKAREWAANYPQSSDGRNTLILLAEWIENR